MNFSHLLERRSGGRATTRGWRSGSSVPLLTLSIIADWLEKSTWQYIQNFMGVFVHYAMVDFSMEKTGL